MASAGLGEQEAEVGICGDDDPVLVERSLQDDVVPGCAEVDVSRGDDVVARSSKFVGEER